MLKTTPTHFLLHDQPLRILSGALHYFRVPRAYWEDRLLKLKAMGLNTVETYVPWNLHQPTREVFHTHDELDLSSFLRLAQELGLHAIVRPGPYICAEWEFGGLPAWLLEDPRMQVRCMYPPYLQAVEAYFGHILPLVKKHLLSEGGNVLAVQIENEYGSYGTDELYLHWIEAQYHQHGLDTLHFTSDGPEKHMLDYGTLPHIYKTVNFGSHVPEAFQALRERQTDQPLMCMEFWNGWFDHWRESHHIRDAQDAARTLQEMLALGGHVNIYMFHGGTSWGVMSGANHIHTFEPTINSYDYDAPLNESGEPTEKFHLYREVLQAFHDHPLPALPAPLPKTACPSIPLKKGQNLLESLLSLPSQPSIVPFPMEDYGQHHGLIAYTHTFRHSHQQAEIRLSGVHDRAYLYRNHTLIGIQDRTDGAKVWTVDFAVSDRFTVVVENQSRINYGPLLLDRKGITGQITLGNLILHHWEVRHQTLQEPEQASSPFQAGNGWFQAELVVPETPQDTHLQLPGTKGYVWVNGRLLGRYWEVGPQYSLFIPAPFLQPGKNQIQILELEHLHIRDLHFSADACWEKPATLSLH